MLKNRFLCYNLDKRGGILMNNNDYLNQPIKKNDDYMYQTPIDPRTDFGKGITFKSVDGKDWATYEDAMAYNKLYYDILMIKSGQDLEKTSGRQR